MLSCARLIISNSNNIFRDFLSRQEYSFKQFFLNDVVFVNYNRYKVCYPFLKWALPLTIYKFWNKYWFEKRFEDGKCQPLCHISLVCNETTCLYVQSLSTSPLMKFNSVYFYWHFYLHLMQISL